MSAGTEFASMARKHFHLSPRTRQYREGLNMKREILEAIANATQYPGYYSEAKTETFRAAWPAYLSYTKHVDGYRIAGEKAYAIEKMTPWQFAGFLGQMIDAGVSNTFEGEVFFQKMSVAA